MSSVRIANSTGTRTLFSSLPLLWLGGRSEIATLNRPFFCGVGALPLALWTAPHDNLKSGHGVRKHLPPWASITKKTTVKNKPKKRDLLSPSFWLFSRTLALSLCRSLSLSLFALSLSHTLLVISLLFSLMSLSSSPLSPIFFGGWDYTEHSKVLVAVVVGFSRTGSLAGRHLSFSPLTLSPFNFPFSYWLRICLTDLQISISLALFALSISLSLHFARVNKWILHTRSNKVFLSFFISLSFYLPSLISHFISLYLMFISFILSFSFFLSLFLSLSQLSLSFPSLSVFSLSLSLSLCLTS